MQMQLSAAVLCSGRQRYRRRHKYNAERPLVNYLFLSVPSCVHVCVSLSLHVPGSCTARATERSEREVTAVTRRRRSG
jgi:hypothetical protein